MGPQDRCDLMSPHGWRIAAYHVYTLKVVDLGGDPCLDPAQSAGFTTSISMCSTKLRYIY
jgi:hypothetical protein